MFGPEACFSGELAPAPAALEYLLARATHAARPRLSPQRALAQLFGIELAPDADVPVAAVTRGIDMGEADAGWWLRADPVHLRADRAGLVLLGPDSFRLSNHDALALAADLHGLLAPTGTLEVPRPGRWYLRLASDPGLRTHELDAVTGRDIRRFLPGGPDAQRWQRLLNEIQMQLHAHELNRQREARGEPAINSLWFWGGGTLPQEPARRWQCVFGGDVFVQGLAQLSATPWEEIATFPEPAPAQPAARPLLAVLDACAAPVRHQDLSGWADALRQLEAGWFAPCRELLARGVLRQLVILTDSARFTLTPWSRWRLWRRPLPFRRWCPGAETS